MGDGLAALRAMEYPGRVIVIGRSLGGEWLVGYAVTGRSPSSRARRLVVRSDSNLYTEPIDPKLLASGNPALLVYPAIVRCKCGVVVSNGAQTTPVHERLCAEPGASAEQVLASALAAPVMVEGIDVTAYEPDAPNYTPRITACVRAASAAMAICRRRPDGGVERTTFDATATAPGEGRLLSVYSGANVNPLPSFQGGPIRIDVDATSAGSLADALWAALAPAPGRDDLRVAVAAVQTAPDAPFAIVNRDDVLA